jgi:hypothetical protein
MKDGLAFNPGLTGPEGEIISTREPHSWQDGHLPDQVGLW